MFYAGFMLIDWSVWERFRTKRGKVYMTRYSHDYWYAWEIWDVTSTEFEKYQRIAQMGMRAEKKM